MKKILLILQEDLYGGESRMHVSYTNEYEVGGSITEYELKDKEQVSFEWFRLRGEAVLRIVDTNIYLVVSTDSLQNVFKKGVNTKNFTIFDPTVVKGKITI